MNTTPWSPEAGPKISAAWHAIRSSLDLNGPMDEGTLVAVATSTGIVEKTATNLLRELRNHGYVRSTKGVYRLADAANVPAVLGARDAAFREAMLGAEWPNGSRAGCDGHRHDGPCTEQEGQPQYATSHGFTPSVNNPFADSTACRVMLARYQCPYTKDQHDPSLPPVDVDVFGYRRAPREQEGDRG